MEKQAVIIAVSGWKRSGKDTAAEFLINNYGAKRLAFADPLKEGVAAEFGLTRAFIDDPATKEAPLLDMMVSPRDSYSRMIAEFMFKEFRTSDGKTPTSISYIEGAFVGWVKSDPPMRASHFEPLYWTPRALCILKGSTMRSADADYWVKRAAAQASTGGLYVISDLRYTNEANSLKASGAKVITVRINRFETSPSNDPSERDLDNYVFDYVIENKGSIADLNQAISALLVDAEVVKTERSQAV
jgi:hypothetical protein